MDDINEIDTLKHKIGELEIVIQSLQNAVSAYSLSLRQSNRNVTKLYQVIKANGFHIPKDKELGKVDYINEE